MALYWPEQKLALEIIDDPEASPVREDLGPDWRVKYVTVSQVMDAENMMELGDEIAEMLGAPRPKRAHQRKKPKRRFAQESEW